MDVSVDPQKRRQPSNAGTWQTLVEFSLPSDPGNERKVMQQVAETIQSMEFSVHRLEQIKTAVAETALNAIEHGNEYRHELLVTIRVMVSDQALAVQISDQSGDRPIPTHTPPDLDAKLAGRQSPRGWGLFLIQRMVDDMRVLHIDNHHVVELIFRLGNS
jgi:anti-sigma regulatory factor (Ser/Thr protein kinase)